MKWALILNGVIHQIFDIAPLLAPALAQSIVAVPDNAKPGWFEVDGSWLPPPLPPPPVPERITVRQLILAAAASGWISGAEAETWAAGAGLPAILTAVIATLPAEQQLAARVTALRMTEARRDDPLLAAVATAAGADDAALDAFFVAAGAL